jgi:transposase
VYPAVLSQSGLAVALRALAEEAEGRLRVVVSPSVEARRRSGVVEAAAYFIVATLPVMLAAGQRVVRVPTRLMADARRAGRDRGKSDPIDAEAVVWATLRHPDLPVASLDGASREVKLLSDFRRDLVRQRTQVCTRFAGTFTSWTRRCTSLPRPSPPLCGRPDRPRARPLRWCRSPAGPRAVGRCADLNRQITGLERELQTLVRQLAPSLLAVRGCGVLSAAVLVGAAGVERFRSKDHFARFTGTAPIPVWSGASEGKVRLNRGGTRLTNTALHMIAVTQSRTEGAGRAYLEKAQARGKTRTEAIRLLRGRISDAVFAALRADAELIKLTVPSTPHQTMPAAA